MVVTGHSAIPLAASLRSRRVQTFYSAVDLFFRLKSSTCSTYRVTASDSTKFQLHKKKNRSPQEFTHDDNGVGLKIAQAADGLLTGSVRCIDY